MNDFVTHFIPSGLQEHFSRLALRSPAMRPQAFMEIKSFCKHHRGCECVMFHHLHDEVSPVYVVEDPKFTSSRLDHFFRDVEAKEIALVNKALWDSNHHDLLLPSLVQTWMFQTWFLRDLGWNSPGAYNLEHLKPLITSNWHEICPL